MPVGGDGRHIVLDLEMPLSKMNERIYVIFDLIQRQAWAFSASCGRITTCWVTRWVREL